MKILEGQVRTLAVEVSILLRIELAELRETKSPELFFRPASL